MFKAVKRTEGVSTTDIVRNQRHDFQHYCHRHYSSPPPPPAPPPPPCPPPPSPLLLLNHNHHRGLYCSPHDHQVGRMLTCGMEHFVEDDEMRGTSAIFFFSSNSLLSSITFSCIQASEPAMFQRMTPSLPLMQFVVPTSFPPATASGVELLMT